MNSHAQFRRAGHEFHSRQPRHVAGIGAVSLVPPREEDPDHRPYVRGGIGRRKIEIGDVDGRRSGAVEDPSSGR